MSRLKSAGHGVAGDAAGRVQQAEPLIVSRLEERWERRRGESGR